MASVMQRQLQQFGPVLVSNACPRHPAGDGRRPLVNLALVMDVGVGGETVTPGPGRR